MDDFEKELKLGFLEEASQLLSDAEQCFLILESNPNDSPTIEKIFRIAHNIKGSSKAVGFDALGAFTHEFESFLLKCKNGQLPVQSSTVSLFLKCNDHIKNWIETLKENFDGTLDNSSLIQEIHNFKPENETTAATPDPVVEEPSAELIEEISNQFDEAVNSTQEQESSALSTVNDTPNFADLEKLAIQSLSSVNNRVADIFESTVASLADEGSKSAALTTPSPTPAQSVAPSLNPVQSTTSPPAQVAPAAASSEKGQVKASTSSSSDESIRVSVGRLEKLLDYVGELVILQTVLREQSYGTNVQLLRKNIQQLGKVTKEVQDISMGMRMIPLKQTFQKMQRIVRDTSGLLGKKVQLVLEGEETEVDKTVLESLGDPLVHLIRNAVDHGIEMPEDRVKKGKPEMGQVILRAYHQGGKLVIEIKDNGGGISAERLTQKAIEKGILKPNQTLSEKDAVNLIFHPGFSTKAQVTEVSGRGVGMDVVKTNIEQLQGDILVETKVGEGSVFKIVLPLTLAIIDGMIVRCQEDKFVVPLTHVHESIKVEKSHVKFVTGLGEVLLLRGENLPLIRLDKALNRQVQKESEHPIAIIVRNEVNPFAIMVDDIIGQHQVVVKKLGQEMSNLHGYSGSAILGDGKPALILELGDLIAHSKPQTTQNLQNKRTVAA